MRLFGRGKKAEKEAKTPQDSIMHMKTTADMLERKENHLLSKIGVEEGTARTLAATNKPAALAALKRKKMYEQHLEHTRGARFNLEAQIVAIENANMNLETLAAMRVGSQAMKRLHEGLGEGVGRVDEVVDDIREQMDIAQEISQAIGTPLGFELGLVDEDELLGELEALEQEELDKSLLSGTLPPSTVKSAASRSLDKVAVVDEEDELKKLQASMML